MITSYEVAVLDVGVGNVDAVARMATRAGGNVSLVSDGKDILGAKRLIIPGVGKFDPLMKVIAERELVGPLRAAADNGIAILGICLGMQVLFERSDEGKLPGLGLLPGEVSRIHDHGQAVPHIGWSRVDFSQALFDDRGPSSKSEEFYFCHSYAVESSELLIAGYVEHGYRFVAAVRRGLITGVQFHPEKSHDAGLRLFESFLGYQSA